MSTRDCWHLAFRNLAPLFNKDSCWGEEEFLLLLQDVPSSSLLQNVKDGGGGKKQKTISPFNISV
jgi:hypothetical protein